MASASILHSEDQFLCSICLGVFTDPISIPCGHNYCETCITQLWDVTDVCKCPLCNKTFHRRPEVFVNKVLSELADQFRKSSVKQEAAKADEVSCDVCTGTKLKAVKSCLVCLTSYCETHLEPHSRLKRHKLIKPVKNLEDFLCQKHDRPLELFCKTDNTCVCSFCTESDHRSHHVVSLEEEWKIKKAELGKKEAEVQQMVQERQVKIQEVKHSVELSKKDADREIADSVQVFTALISCIQKSQSKLIDMIEEKQKTTEKQAEGFIKDLQQEITQLEKRGSELKHLSHTEDLYLLQNFASIHSLPPTNDWTKVNVHQSPHVRTMKTALAQLEKTLSQEFEKKLCGVEQLRSIKKYAVPVPLVSAPGLCLRLQASSGSTSQASKKKPGVAAGGTGFKTRTDFASHSAYEKYVQDHLKSGMMVRLLEKYEAVSAGDVGDFRCSYEGYSPVQAFWPSLASTYWVDWHMIEILGYGNAEQAAKDTQEKASSLTEMPCAVMKRRT